MTDRPRASWLVYALGALCAGAIAAAFLVVGPPSESAAAHSRIVTAQQGVVQSTVSGSGNIQSATQLNLGFKTTGVVSRIYVSEGQQVAGGQLIAELNPQSAEVTLEQAKATLQAAEATLAQEEETGGETSSGGGSGSGAKSAAADTEDSSTAARAELAAYAPPTTTTPTTSSPAPAGTTTPITTTTPTTTTTTPRSTQPTGATRSNPSTSTPSTTTTSRSTTSTTSATTPSSSEKTKQSLATREANLASARAAVRSDMLSVQSAEEAVADTKLVAPESGTIVSLSGEVGETVSGGGTSKAAASSTSSSSSTTGAAGAGAGTGARASTSTAATDSSSTGSGSSSSSAFAVLSDLNTLELVVPLSESEIIHVHVGQPATVTVEALEGLKLAGEVVNVASVATSNSGVVSYDVTFQLNQASSEIKPGMSASAEVVVKQEEGVNVPTSAISADTVTVVRSGKDVRQRVVTGLAGNSSTIILSGLKAGEQVLLPITSTSSSTSLTSRLGSRTSGLGGAGAIGGGALGGGGGGAAFFRGGG